MLDHIGYNNLLTISEADRKFTDRQQWFQKLGPLLGRAEFRDKYNLCLVHRHFILQPDERMVANGLITQPETISGPASSDIIPSSWTAAGIPFEWKSVKAPDEIVDPPPAELIGEFLEIVGDGGVLGLCLAQDLLPEGQIWSEHSNRNLRQHILEKKSVETHSSVPASDTSWRVKTSSDGTETSFIFVCGCNCCDPNEVDHSDDGHRAPPPPPPPPGQEGDTGTSEHQENPCPPLAPASDPA
jgi:hypothetical protein